MPEEISAMKSYSALSQLRHAGYDIFGQPALPAARSLTYGPFLRFLDCAETFECGDQRQ